MTVDALDDVLMKHPRNDHRHYLCHFTVLPPAHTMELMAKDKIHIAQQPNFTYNLEGRYVETLEGNRLATNNAITTPVKKYGLFMAFGSDNLPIGPMVGLYAAVTRKGESGKVYGPGEAISIKEAITMYTRNGAFLTREEKIKGTLEAGKLADMIVLPEDILNVSPEKISEHESRHDDRRRQSSLRTGVGEYRNASPIAVSAVRLFLIRGANQG